MASRAALGAVGGALGGLSDFLQFQAVQDRLKKEAEDQNQRTLAQLIASGASAPQIQAVAQALGAEVPPQLMEAARQAGVADISGDIAGATSPVALEGLLGTAESRLRTAGMDPTVIGAQPVPGTTVGPGTEAAPGFEALQGIQQLGQGQRQAILGEDERQLSLLGRGAEEQARRTGEVRLEQLGPELEQRNQFDINQALRMNELGLTETPGAAREADFANQRQLQSNQFEQQRQMTPPSFDFFRSPNFVGGGGALMFNPRGPGNKLQFIPEMQSPFDPRFRPQSSGDDETLRILGLTTNQTFGQDASLASDDAAIIQAIQRDFPDFDPSGPDAERIIAIYRDRLQAR